MNTVSQTTEADVVVVGAGPVGAATALSLAKISPELSIILIDRQPVQRQSVDEFDTRVFAINKGSRTLFENMGIWTAIQKTRVCAYQKMHVWDAEGTGFLDFTAEELVVPELGHIIEAGLIQNALEDEISLSSNIQLLRPVEIDALELEQDYVFIQLKSGEQLRASLLVAADGSRSVLREIAGISTVDDDCKQQALVANIRLTNSHQNCAWQIFRSTGPLAFLPLDNAGDQKLCSIVWTLNNEQAEEIKVLDKQAFEQALQNAVESRFGCLEMISDLQSFPLIQSHAKAYSKSALVLVGDAAHSIHPLAGLGANLGFQDVQALTKEIGRAHTRGIDLNHPAVLARYQRQRKLDNELTLKLMALFRDSFADQGVVFNGLRNLGLKALTHWPSIKNLLARQALMSD